MIGRAYLILLLIPACAAETVDLPPSAPVNWLALETRAQAVPVKLTEQERASTEGYIKALGSPGFGELPLVLDEMAHFECGSTEARGKKRVIAAHEATLGSFDRRSFSVSRAWLTNDEKAIAWAMNGVQAGKPITVHGLTILWTKDDASISDVHMYLEGPAEPPAGEPRMLEKSGDAKEIANVALVRSLVQSLQDNQEPAFVAPFGDPIKEQARTWFRNTRKSVGQLDTAIETAWSVQDFAVIEYTLSGRQQDRLVRRAMVDIGEIRDGKITRMWRYGQ